MRKLAPALMPIFRSQRLAEMLAILFLHPSAELSLTELAERLNASPGTIHADIARLLDAGLITERFVGRTRLISANSDARAARPLSELLLLTFGPEHVIADEFDALEGVSKVLIFGSWARRYNGQQGPEPGDIDVMVIGSPNRENVYDAADRAAEKLGIQVNPAIRSSTAWKAGADALVITAKNDAHVVIEREETNDEC